MEQTSSVPPSVRIVRVPTAEDVDQIAALENPVLRNLRITHTYHLISRHFSASTVGGANWCTFAVWASRQAGATIRGEDALDLLERRLRHAPHLVEEMNRVWRRVLAYALENRESRRSVLVRILARGALSRASGAVARGNRKVFEEIAREFARFLPLCEPGRVNPDALASYLSELAPGAPPEGQDYLRLAFSHYAAALETSDPGTRAELLLLANLLIGLHEQTRLQPEILEALEVPFDTMTGLGHSLLNDLLPRSRQWGAWRRTPLALMLGAAVRGVALPLRELLRHVVTERMMTLALPGTVIHLGRDLEGEFPTFLREPRTTELVELLNRYSPTPDDRNGVGASDWSVLEQRMQLIAKLFRLRHEDGTLFADPYTMEQVLAFEEGRLPDGEL